ncbi:unnamed protein product, partial [Rotaria sordida]
MSNSDANNLHLTNASTMSSSLSTFDSTLMSPPPTDIIFSTSITPISTTPRRIVKAKRSF